MTDGSFQPDRSDLDQAVEALFQIHESEKTWELPQKLPEQGIGESAVIDQLAPIVLGRAAHLGTEETFAHMDPPTPWISWVTTLWNASLNQNLLHPDLSPVAKKIENRVIDWLTPYFGMDGGHMTPGSTVSNLTAIWAARELKGIKRVIASNDAHLSVEKSTHLLGLKFEGIETNPCGKLDASKLPDNLSNAALVLTAGATSTGAIDPLDLHGRAAWTHVDAAWAGPLRLSQTYAKRLNGIDQADSVSISAHKWFFQPKEAGLILFKDTKMAHEVVSFGGEYLASPNVGILGSRGASAIPLLATLLSWGHSGFQARIDRSMSLADTLWSRLQKHPRTELYGSNITGIVLWRPEGCSNIDAFFSKLPVGSASLTTLDDLQWVRNVAANPCVDINKLWSRIELALG